MFPLSTLLLYVLQPLLVFFFINNSHFESKASKIFEVGVINTCHLRDLLSRREEKIKNKKKTSVGNKIQMLRAF